MAEFDAQPDIRQLVINLAAITAERAISRDWNEHPMCGIAVDKDKWAVAYQRQLALIEQALQARQ